MKKNILLYSTSALLTSMPSLAFSSEDDTERPNILWLTFEDTSWFEFGCYGNNQVKTPNIDALAKSGIQFMNAWSVAPQSSPARSSLITGCYATTYGMDVHPRPYDTPDNIFFPQLLREQGYYCTNNSKTHYNTTVNNKSFWDECDNKATYNSLGRQDNQPFFAVFNTVTSHMGRVRTFHLDGRRDYTQEGIYPSNLILPNHVPDVYEVRSDYAAHLEAVQDVDEWVGHFVEDLKENDLYDNTIIFVFSDHGGCLPRGKGYLFETGLKVPMIVHIPDKWKHLSADIQNGKNSSLISFIDLGPTVLSLAGIEPPKYMQGQTLMGEFAVAEMKSKQYAFAANQLHHFMPVRASTDGRYKYIRTYIPYKQFALRNYYQWGMPANKAWDKLFLGKCEIDSVLIQPYIHNSTEMLFDLESDPFETINLANNPEFSDVLFDFRNSLIRHIADSGDLGFFTPSFRENVNLYEEVYSNNYPLNELHDISYIASKGDIDDIDLMKESLQNNDENIRYWAAVGIAHLCVKGYVDSPPEEFVKLLGDSNPYIACEAAFGLAYTDKYIIGIERLINPINENDRKIGYSLLETISLDHSKHYLFDNYLSELEDKAYTLPAVENEDSGLMARGILVNLGRYKIDAMHGEDSFEKGVKLNRGRRPLLPLPIK